MAEGMLTDDDGGDGGNFDLIGRLAERAYVVRVGSFDGSRGTSALHVNRFEDDRPGSRAGVTPVDFGSPVAGSIGGGSDADYFWIPPAGVAGPARIVAYTLADNPLPDGTPVAWPERAWWMWRPMGGRRGTPDIGALGRDANASAGRAVAPRWGTAYKRPFDLAALYVVGVLLAPLWLLIAVAVALAVKLGDGGPVLYRQRRLGLGGRVFELVKFRTMPVDSEDATGPVWAAQPDRRATPVGRLLRRLRLDELPQALNVLRGEMSLVGPRPERPELAPRCERAAPGFARRLAVRPGLAGLAQARRGAAATPRQKLRYDLLYIEAMGPWLDIRLCAACLLRVLAAAVPSRRRIRRGHPPRTGAPARPPVRRQDGPHYLRYRNASATVAGMRRQTGHPPELSDGWEPRVARGEGGSGKQRAGSAWDTHPVRRSGCPPLSMAIENCTLLATENCTLSGRTFGR